MWEAYEAGTIPVGAVIADSTGNIVSRGRNRAFDATSPGQLASSRLAHAEMNALLCLSSDRTYEDFELYTALEPCHLCLSATITVRIGTLRYAAADAYGGAVGKLVPSRDHDAHPLRVDGPLNAEIGRLPELLLIAHHLWRRPDGDVVHFYSESYPHLAEAARRLPYPGAGALLEDAADCMIGVL